MCSANHCTPRFANCIALLHSGTPFYYCISFIQFSSVSQYHCTNNFISSCKHLTPSSVLAFRFLIQCLERPYSGLLGSVVNQSRSPLKYSFNLFHYSVTLQISSFHTIPFLWTSHLFRSSPLSSTHLSDTHLEYRVISIGLVRWSCKIQPVYLIVVHSFFHDYFPLVQTPHSPLFFIIKTL